MKPTAARTFHSWVRGTGGFHTSCLISTEGKFCFQDPMQRYLANDVKSHLASMCRIVGDCGSVLRDRDEENLNSADFSEFTKPSDGEDAKASDAQNKIRSLMDITDYERACVVATFAKPREKLPKGIRSKLELFVDVAMLYGEIYVERDIGVTVSK